MKKNNTKVATGTATPAKRDALQISIEKTNAATKARHDAIAQALGLGCSVRTHDREDMLALCQFFKSHGVTTQYSTIFGSEEDDGTSYEVIIHCDLPRAEELLREYVDAKIERKERVEQEPAKREAFADWIAQIYVDARLDQLRRRRDWQTKANSMTLKERAKLAVSLAEAEALERELRDLYVCALDEVTGAWRSFESADDVVFERWYNWFQDNGDNLDG